MKKMKSTKIKLKTMFLAMSMMLTGGSVAVIGCQMSAYAETSEVQDEQANENSDDMENESKETDETKEIQSNPENDEYGVAPCSNKGKGSDKD